MLLEGGRDVLLERVAELLGSAASRAHPFCTQLRPQAQSGSHGGPTRTRTAPSLFPGHSNTTLAVSAWSPTVLPPPPSSEGGLATAHGPSGPSRHHPHVGTSRRTAWHTGHYSEAFRVAASEEYMPHMMDQGHAQEEDHGSFLGPSWGEETPEAELF